MLDVSNTRTAKAQELRALARQFRNKADETQLMKYVDLMRRSAAELERLADQLEAEIEGDMCVSRF